MNALRSLFVAWFVAVVIGAHVCLHESQPFQRMQRLDLLKVAVARMSETSHQNRAFRAHQADFPAFPGPLRIRVFATDLNATGRFCAAPGNLRPDFKGGMVSCSSSDVLTDDKRRVLTETILPEAISRISMRVNVQPLASPIRVHPLACTQHTKEISHSITGVDDTDYVLYVSAGPIVGHQTVAWAGHCQVDDDSGRPVVGRANFDPQFLTSSPAAFEELVDAATHEILHALGISSSMLGAEGLTEIVERRGKLVTEVITPRVVEAARTFSMCENLTGVELEDEDNGSPVSGHVERRVWADDIMAAVGGTQISVVTLALLQDLNVGYITDSFFAEPMEFGHEWGCGFHFESCGKPAGQGNYFCGENTPTPTCTANRAAIGSCALRNYSDELPQHFQHFSHPRTGGTAQMMDYCAVIEPFWNRNCTSTNHTMTDDEADFGYAFGDNARCFDTSEDFVVATRTGDSWERARCLRVRCVSGATGPRLKVKPGQGSWADCPASGASAVIVIPGYTGNVTCPDAADVCQDFSLFTFNESGSDFPPLPTPLTSGSAGNVSDGDNSTDGSGGDGGGAGDNSTDGGGGGDGGGDAGGGAGNPPGDSLDTAEDGSSSGLGALPIAGIIGGVIVVCGFSAAAFIGYRKRKLADPTMKKAKNLR